ncbi:MAG: hypothetical protein C0483_10235 [Pirellula sp.]|nr:hypothetical protein [Pirellula sp.]
MKIRFLAVVWRAALAFFRSGLSLTQENVPIGREPNRLSPSRPIAGKFGLIVFHHEDDLAPRSTTQTVGDVVAMRPESVASDLRIFYPVE